MRQFLVLCDGRPRRRRGRYSPTSHDKRLADALVSFGGK